MYTYVRKENYILFAQFIRNLTPSFPPSIFEFSKIRYNCQYKFYPFFSSSFLFFLFFFLHDRAPTLPIPGQRSGYRSWTKKIRRMPISLRIDTRWFRSGYARCHRSKVRRNKSQTIFTLGLLSPEQPLKSKYARSRAARQREKRGGRGGGRGRAIEEERGGRRGERKKEE